MQFSRYGSANVVFSISSATGAIQQQYSSIATVPGTAPHHHHDKQQHHQETSHHSSSSSSSTSIHPYEQQHHKQEGQAVNEEQGRVGLTSRRLSQKHGQGACPSKCNASYCTTNKQQQQEAHPQGDYKCNLMWCATEHSTNQQWEKNPAELAEQNMQKATWLLLTFRDRR